MNICNFSMFANMYFKIDLIQTFRVGVRGMGT